MASKSKRYRRPPVILPIKSSWTFGQEERMKIKQKLIQQYFIEDISNDPETGKRSETINVRRGIQGDYKIFLEEMELEYTKKTYYKKILKGDKAYKDWIMMSEWLIDIPSDFQENWLCTICPEGKRVLVIAEKGSTKAYSRRGDFLMKFPSALPGGCGQSSRGHTILDCIWHHPMRTFYLLDVLIWGVPLTNCEAELRFYWLSNKFSETPNLTKFSETNRHKFLLLQRRPVSELQQMMAVHPPFENNFPKADGVLFFHKDSLYTSGKSPLVTWLKPFMIPHILNVPVAMEYNLEKPSNYPDKPPNVLEKQRKKSKGIAKNSSEESSIQQDTSMDIETASNVLSNVETLNDVSSQNGVTSQLTVINQLKPLISSSILNVSEAAEASIAKPSNMLEIPENQTNDPEKTADNCSEIIADNEEFCKKQDLGMDIETPNNIFSEVKPLNEVSSKNGINSQLAVTTKNEIVTQLNYKPVIISPIVNVSEAVDIAQNIEKPSNLLVEKPEKQINESEVTVENISEIITNDEQSYTLDTSMDIENTSNNTLSVLRSLSDDISDNEVTSQDTVLSKNKITTKNKVPESKQN